MIPGDDLRIGDAEREATMAALREHYAQGRLTHQELDERLGLALTARTGRELALAREDLPDLYGAADRTERRPGDQAGWKAQWHGDRDAWRAQWHADRDTWKAQWHGDRDAWRAQWKAQHHAAHAAWKAQWHADRAAWKAQWKAQWHADRDAWRAQWRAERAARHGHAGRHHHPARRGGPPIVPLLLLALFIAVVTGGFGILKFVLLAWLVIGLFRMVHHRSHARRISRSGAP
ncbi:DUF1707 domain-containing protein [Planobispora siamensis]|uniref:DUF1707 domain-containing protein n=1 Tax=Planobispora siamensis TaxID=936338 RepID=A0A8J3WIM0_9ACTN|nr:DUF1707 domain-containing protein [Planobispora siamensis]GIH90708.1 hypothetical protein Psi01_13380 [Planobispora siamensis]